MNNSSKPWTDLVMAAIALTVGARIADAFLDQSGRVAFRIVDLPAGWSANVEAIDATIPAGEVFRAMKVLRQVIRDVKANKFNKEKYNVNPYFAN